TWLEANNMWRSQPEQMFWHSGYRNTTVRACPTPYVRVIVQATMLASAALDNDVVVAEHARPFSRLTKPAAKANHKFAAVRGQWSSKKAGRMPCFEPFENKSTPFSGKIRRQKVWSRLSSVTPAFMQLCFTGSP